MMVSVGAVVLLSFWGMAKPAPARAAGLLIADGGLGGVLEIKEQDVQVVINNWIAVTQIRQVFLNTESRIVEALYTFPVPNGASVSNFSMVINGQEMTGEVVEKKRARQIYESYKAVRRDPGLLEQVDYKTFELRIFPIPAGAEQEIEVTYCQQLDFDHDNATYVYPLATVTRSNINQTTTGKFAFTLDVKSEIPITKLFSPSHGEEFVVVEHTPNYRRASLEVEKGDLSRDLVIAYDTERPRTGIDLITSKAPGEDGYFFLTMTAGKELEEYGAGMDYVFLVDISGSMANDGKLNQSRSTVETFVTALGAEDRFEIITFNNVPTTLFGNLTKVDEASQKSAREALLAQRARGGTVLRPAVTTAYKYKDADRPLNVVLLSDGMTETGEQAQLLSLISSAPSGTRVFCIGVGNEVNRPLLKQMAEGAGGLAAFVSQQDDFARQAQAFRRKLMRPVAQNVTIAVEAVETFDVTPEALPDLFYGAPLRIFGRYRGAGQANVTVKADVMGQPVTQTVQVTLPEKNDDNPEIERMWAYEQVQQLMGEMRKNGESQTTVEKIVSLCEGYSIAGEYASFIVLENDAEYQRWAIDRRNATRVKRDDAARVRLQEQLQALRDASVSQLGPKEPQAAQKSAEPTELAANDTSSAPSFSAPQPAPSTPTDLNWSPRNRRNNGPSFQGGGGGGGGAIDPVTGLLAAGLAAATAWAGKRRKRTPVAGSEETRGVARSG
jgi:Ca-activated chloride channel family protein